MQTVAPFDWAKFFEERVYGTSPHAPTNGITKGGWRMAWADSLGPLQAAAEIANKRVTESYTLGLELDETGKVRDIVPGSPADAAGVAPDMKVVAVNGRRYEKDVLRDAIAASRQSGAVDLLCENKAFFRTYRLDYRGGRRYPALERDAATQDWVMAILSPHVK